MDLVLARKYRPENFEEVVGQNSTIAQLKGAIEKQALGHALIFAGTRGTGKTTTARILGRVLNEGRSPGEVALAVTEVDGASNSGVDEVRSLIDSVKYATQGHRVVILDEAHMLTRNAFNALLKTLEEPPSKVTFVLSTTELHKIPATIRSRCQIYEFREVDLDTLVAHFKSVAQAENLEISDEQLREVALRAEGSVRDGLSLLQKFLSGETIVANADRYFKLVGAIYMGDATTALSLVGELRKEEEPRLIVQTLGRWWHWCSLMNFGLSTPINSYFEGSVTNCFSLDRLQKLFAVTLETEESLTKTPNSKVVLDMGIIALTQVE